MSRMRYITVLYEEEATNISRWTLQYPNIETGGNLFGLWRSETEVVIQLAIGPGDNCRRTTTSFFQDEQYLGDVGTYLTSTEGLCNIGEWHSHHSLNLPEPSSDDRQIIWRYMSRYGLKRFLLLIATVKSGLANTHSFMFTLPENASRSGEMFPTNCHILPEPNPFRAKSEVQERLNIGAEMLVRSSSREFKDNRNRIKEENKERKKMERKNSKRDKKEKKKNEKEMRKKEKDERAENETAKECEEKRKDGSGKRKRLWPSRSKKVDGKIYSELHDEKLGMGASSRTACDGVLNTNLSNGPDANLSTQHVPESQYRPSNDKNTSNFDNDSGTKKIEGKEVDKAEDMISNDLQAQSEMIDGTQTRQTSDFQENPEDECPNKDDEDDEDRQTSETHRGSETEQLEPRDVNGGTRQRIKPNGMGTEVDTPDCPSERNSVPQSTDDDEKIGATSNGISLRCDDAKDATSKNVARNECQRIDETDKQTAEKQKGFETERSAPNINHGTEEPKLISTEVRAKSMEENLLGQPLKKDQRSESPKLDCPVAADNSRETHYDEDHDDSTVSSHEAEGDQSNDPDIDNSSDQICSNPSNNNARTTSTLSETNGQPKIVKEEYDKLAKMIIEKETPSIPVDCENVGSRKVEITLEFQSTAEYQLTCEKKTEQEPRDVNGGTRQKIKPNGMGTEVETPDCPSERNSVPQSTDDDDEKIGATSNGISSRCDDAKDVSEDVARNECQPKDETDKQTAETQKGFETERSAPNINHETKEPKPTSTEVRAKPMEENRLGQSLKKDQRSESPKLDDLVAADNSRETRSDDEDHDDSTVSSHEVEGDQSNAPDIENSLDQTCSNPSNNRSTSTMSQTNGQPKIVNAEYDELAKMIINKIKSVIVVDCKNVGCRYVYITVEFQSTKYQLTCQKGKGETSSKTTVTLNVGHEQLVETQINDSIEEVAEFAAENIFQHQQVCRS